MSRFSTWALGALLALSLAAALDHRLLRRRIAPATAVKSSNSNSSRPQSHRLSPNSNRASSASPASAAQTQQQQQQQQTQPQAVSAEPLNVVVSTQVIADWVRQVGGDRVNVRALVPAGADVHLLDLSVSDIRAIADADLVVINGAGLESAYEDVIRENAENVLDLAIAIEEAGHELLPFGAMMEEDGREDEQGHEDDEEMHDDDHGAAEAIGRLLIADALEAHLSVIDLSTEEVNSRPVRESPRRGRDRVCPAPLTATASSWPARTGRRRRPGAHLRRRRLPGRARRPLRPRESDPVSRHSLEIVEEMARFTTSTATAGRQSSPTRTAT